MKKSILVSLLLVNICANAGHMAKITDKLFHYLSTTPNKIFTLKKTMRPHIFNNGTYYGIELIADLHNYQEPVSKITYRTIKSADNICDALYIEKKLSTQYPKINTPLITLTLLHLLDINIKNILVTKGPDIPLTQSFIDKMIQHSYKDLE